MSMSPTREKHSELTNSIAQKLKRSQEKRQEKNVEQHRSITCESPHRAHLSYSRWFGSLGHSDFGPECVHKTG